LDFNAIFQITLDAYFAGL